ncbi:AbrB/MazE/SpoVT family DNA-binding domain-containing protein [Candidatus Bathyarchaeota archaeon]|nr:AbrB/MazE/SpoVT family DNA-binding domain-containing protein [Candidatus Bathyarchaeota archaeon]
MGILFLVLGSSGSGKDTLIQRIIEKYPENLPSLRLARRVVTKKTVKDVEDFDSVEPETFLRMKTDGKFILDWQSYDNYYGVRGEVATWLREGHPVIANVSRSVVEQAEKLFPEVRTILVHVPIEVMAERIINRGRETFEEVLDRLIRAQETEAAPRSDLSVENVGDVEDTSDKILRFIVDEIERIMVASFESTVTKQGQATLPKALRDKYGIREGDKIVYVDLGDHIAIIPQPLDPLAVLKQIKIGTGKSVAEKKEGS